MKITKHLFIINPFAKHVKGKVEAFKQSIAAFFEKCPQGRKPNYDIFITEWCRDAVTYARKYVAGNPDCIVRIHAIGGTGTLLEAVNGAIGFDNAEVAAYPYGESNSFLRYFGVKNVHLFTSFEKQVTGRAALMDVIRCGNNYSICYGLTGIDVHGNSTGSINDAWKSSKLPVLKTLSVKFHFAAKGKLGQWYRLNVDGREFNENFATIMVANAPCYGTNMYPAIDAHPDDGVLNIYMFKEVPKIQARQYIARYCFGKYKKLPPGVVMHLTGKKIRVESDKVLNISTDGEVFQRDKVEFEIVPKAVRFVLPEEIVLTQLPQQYNNPGSGHRKAGYSDADIAASVLPATTTAELVVPVKECKYEHEIQLVAKGVDETIFRSRPLTITKDGKDFTLELTDVYQPHIPQIGILSAGGNFERCPTDRPFTGIPAVPELWSDAKLVVTNVEINNYIQVDVRIKDILRGKGYAPTEGYVSIAVWNGWHVPHQHLDDDNIIRVVNPLNDDPTRTDFAVEGVDLISSIKVTFKVMGIPT